MGKSIAILLSVITLFVIVFYLINSSIHQNEGKFIYPLDDAYIHMAMAKNLAFEGQWGVTKYEYSSASSSILYTLLNALVFKIIGINVYVPLGINLVAACLIFLSLGIFLKAERINPITLFIVCLLIIFFTPIPALVISGMEHTLQILINLIFIYKSAKYLELKSLNKKSFYQLLLLAALAVSIRFEGIFVVGIISFLFLLKRDIPKSIAIVFFGLLPIIIFGIVSVKNGSYFIPNSLLMKGERPKMNVWGLVQYCFLWLDKIKRCPHLLVLFFWVVIYFLYQRHKKISIWNRTSIIVIIVGLTFVIHLTLAKTGWFYRYEAYLVFLSLFSFIWIIEEGFQKFSFQINRFPVLIGVLFLVMCSLYPLYARGKDALVDVVPATKNIYEQQFQMAAFIKKYYNNESICANDIGAICLFSDVKLFDMFGLASKDIIGLRIKGQFDKENIHRLALEKKVKVVVIYDYWFIGKVPDQWKAAGKWEVENNVILGGPIVTFFATELYDVEELKKNLDAFSSSLPPGVKVLEKW